MIAAFVLGTWFWFASIHCFTVREAINYRLLGTLLLILGEILRRNQM